MTIKTASGAAVLLAAMGLAACGDSNDGRDPLRSISVSGYGEAEAEPDRAEVTVGVQTSGRTAVAASRANEKAISAVMEALERFDIDGDDVATSNYNIWVEQPYERDGNEGKRVVRYHVSNMLRAKIDDIDKVGEVLGAVTSEGANSIHGVQFSVEDTKELERLALERAVADARKRAESLAGFAGVRVGDVISLSTSPGPGQPVPLAMSARMDMAEAAPAPTISPGRHSVGVQVQVTFAIR